MNEKIPRLRITVVGSKQSKVITWNNDQLIQHDNTVVNVKGRNIKTKDSIEMIRTVIKICEGPVTLILQGAFKNDAEAICFSNILQVEDVTIKLINLKHVSISKHGETAILEKLPPETYVTGAGYRETTPTFWDTLTSAFKSKAAPVTERTRLTNPVDVELTAVKPGSYQRPA